MKELVDLVYDWRAAFEKNGRHSHYDGYYFIQSSWSDNDFGYANLEINRKPRAALVDSRGFEAPISPCSVLRTVAQPILRPYRGFEKDTLSIHVEDSMLASTRLLSVRGSQQADYDIRNLSLDSQPRAQRLIEVAIELLERYKTQSDTT